MKKTITTLLILIVLVMGGYFIYDDLKTPVDAGNGDVTVNAYNLTVNAENCTVTIKHGTETIIAGEDVLNEDDTIIITAIADEGYEMDTLLLNDVEIASGDSHVVTGNVTIVATAVEELVNPEPYVVQNGLKLVYNVSDNWLKIGLAGYNGEFDTYGYAYDWDIYLNDEFYGNYSGVTAFNHGVTIMVERGEHVVCLEDKTGNDYCARSVNFFGMFDTSLIEVYGYGNAYTGSSEMPNYCFSEMFVGCENLIIAPELPATTLSDNCYSRMFAGCMNLTIAPALPAITLADNCYNRMFFLCKNLTTIPELLPAIILADYCYYEMFKSCLSLTTGPELPATTLGIECYASMFSGCKNLTIAPELLATTLTFSCYNSMFAGCENLTTAPELLATTLVDLCYYGMFAESGLTTAPELPATILESGCYGSMFRGCENLTIAPALIATTLTSSCYSYMFQDCKNLTTVTCYYPSNLDSTFANGWLDNIPTIGTLKSPDAVITYGLPENWTAVAINESDSGDPEPYVVQNGLKLVYDIGDGDSLDIGLAGYNGEFMKYGCEYDWDVYLDNEFYNNYSGVTAYNYCITITDLEPGEHVICLEDKTGNDYCARSVNFSQLDVINPELDLTEVYGYGNAYTGSSAMPNYCYMFQFCNCENLTVAPELPATILANHCYSDMFFCCLNLIIAPELLATTLAYHCYNCMFENCTNLTSVTCHYPSNLDSTFANDWLCNIPTTGILKSPNGIITYDLPDNWEAVAI